MSFAVLCSGQGGQQSAMFDILAHDADARSSLDAASAAAGIDLTSIARDASFDASRLFENTIAQPLVCAYQAVLWSSLAPRLAPPILFAGYSVGELAAYGCAGSLSISDTIRLARERAAAMTAASGTDDGLVALRGLTRTAVEALCGTHRAAIAIVNGNDHFIIGGSSTALEPLMREAIEKGASAQRLPVSVAAHTPILASASEHFRGVLQSARWCDPSIPVLASIDGGAVRDATTAIDVLARQVSTTIQWAGCMDSAFERGTRVCLELGPGHALARMMRERHPAVEARSVSDFRSLDAVIDWVARVGR